MGREISRGRPATGRQKQLAVSVSDHQRAALEAASAKAGVSVAEEIRQRLNRTLYEDETFDEPTRELAEDIRRLAHEITAQAGSITLPRVLEALAEAIKTWMELTQTEKKDEHGLYGVASWDVLGPNDPPTLGRTIAHTLFRAKPAKEKKRTTDPANLPLPLKCETPLFAGRRFASRR
jgi:hypothetical protein